jgi:alkylation response protein AidB-like acyl-CoA dehydrogenase
MICPSQSSIAESLERFLGDGNDPGVPGSREQALVNDEREAFPEKLYSALQNWGLHHFYVPRAFGGRFDSFEELLTLTRILSRRDLTAAIAHSAVFLGSMPIWIGGSDQQRHLLAQWVMEGGVIAFALTEEAHGSDILANETRAEVAGSGFQLTGRKWLINNAQRSTAIVVFARTKTSGGARGFSLFLVNRKDADAAACRSLPRLKTHGIRGADIGGIEFNHCLVNGQSLVGSIGSGLELTLKTLQVTRTLCAGLALGAAQAALEITIDFALSRQLYGGGMVALPTVQQSLVEAFIDLLICGCVSRAAVRGLHAAPGQLSVWSSIVKYFVPVTLEQTIRNLGTVLGARHFLREGPQGLFQKVLRDSGLISLFDGNTAVNLHNIALQLPFLLKQPSPGLKEANGGAGAHEIVFDLEASLPEFKPQQLELFAYGQELVVAGFERAVADLPALLSQRAIHDSMSLCILKLAEAAVQKLGKLRRSVGMLAGREGSTINKSAALFSHARTYCRLHAAAACVQMWSSNSRHAGLGSCSGQHFLLLALRRLAGMQINSDSRSFTPMFDSLIDAYRNDPSNFGYF